MVWQDFLLAQGAAFDADGGASFAGAPEYLDGRIAVVPLTQFGLLQFVGDDTEAFLQGQLSSDVRQLGRDGFQYSSYSTPKGRMLASLLLHKTADGIAMQLPLPLLPALQKRLSMYVLRSKTRAIDLSQERVMFGLLGQNLAQLVEAALGVSLGGARCLVLDEGWITQLDGERLIFALSPDLAMAYWHKLVAAGAQLAGTAVWTLADIRAGVLWVLPTTQEAFVPQMANMDLIGAVNFKKGCYPGQEIVARTQYLGKLKRRTYRMSVSVAATPGQQVTPGTEVFSAEMLGQPSGQIALVAPSGLDQWEVLVVAQSASIEHGLHLGSLDGPSLSLLELPYALPEPTAATQ